MGWIGAVASEYNWGLAGGECHRGQWRCCYWKAGEPVGTDSDKPFTWLRDNRGRRWAVERIGRTSGTVALRPDGKKVSAPADLIRFTCESDRSEHPREVAVPVGHMERISESELRSLFENALGESPAGTHDP